MSDTNETEKATGQGEGAPADETFGWTDANGESETGGGPAQAAREIVSQIQSAVESMAEKAGPVARDLVERATPVAREIGARAAGLAAVAGDRAGPIAHRAADMTGSEPSVSRRASDDHRRHAGTPPAEPGVAAASLTAYMTATVMDATGPLPAANSGHASPRASAGAGAGAARAGQGRGPTDRRTGRRMRVSR